MRCKAAETAASDPAARPGRLDGETVNRIVKSVAKRARLTRDVRADGLRHCAITTALDTGWDVRDVKAFSRHSKIDTVLIYDDRRADIGGDITAPSAAAAPLANARRERREIDVAQLFPI